jgi:hypothetical protein
MHVTTECYNCQELKTLGRWESLTFLGWGEIVQLVRQPLTGLFIVPAPDNR